MQTEKVLRILFVEDLETDKILAEREIQKGGINYLSLRVDTESEFRVQLEKFEPDLIISDYSMPSFDGMTALKIALTVKPNIPFIILTGSMNEDTAVECMKAGADDYIIKENMNRLIPAIKAALTKYQNIEAKKLAEAALLESESRFRNIFNENLAVMFLIDPETRRFVDTNIAAEKFYGWTKEQLKSMRIDHISILTEEELAEEIKKATMKKRVHFEYKHKKSDGSLCDVEVFTSSIQFSGKTYLHSIVHDITERKNAEESLKTSDRVFRHSIDMLCVSGYDGYFKVLNPSWERTLGWSTSELLSKPWLDFVHPDDKEATENIKSVIVRGQEIYRFENRYICKDGSIKWLAWNTFPYSDEGLMIGVARDVTESKKINIELQQAKEKAERADQLKTEFLAQMSHEIRSPLNAVLSFTGLLEEDLSNSMNEEYKIAFSGIQSASKRIIRTIDLILNMSELQLGTYNPTLTTIDLVAILQRLVKEYNGIAESKVINLIFEPEFDLVNIISDDYALNQTFANLLDNAIKYTKTGSVRVSLRKSENNEQIVEIEDTGIGISQDYLPHLFTPFSQEEQGYSRKFDGTGLGLALVKKYCDVVGAEIQVVSEKNKGTKVSVKLKNMGNIPVLAN